MLVASCIFILLGALCLIGGKIWQFGLLKEERYKGRATGTVAEIVTGVPDEAHKSMGVHDHYYPVVAFYAKGHLYKLKNPKGDALARYQVNERVNVRYDEDDPEKFEIHVNSASYIAAMTVYYLGFLFCCMGGLFFLLFATRT